MDEVPVLVLSAEFFLGADTDCTGFCLIAFLLVVVLPTLKTMGLEILSLIALKLRIPLVLHGYERKIIFY